MKRRNYVVLHYFDSPLFRQHIPTARYSDSPLFRQPIIPTAHYSDSPLFRQPVIPTSHSDIIQTIVIRLMTTLE